MLGNAIHKKSGFPDSVFKNIWSAFLIRCSEMLSDNGILAFVLPSELLQVKFSELIRSFLILKFDRIEIFSFSELLFDHTDQDTVLLICFKKHLQKGQYFVQINDRSKLEQNDFLFKSHICFSNNSIKWTNHILNSDELELMSNLKNTLKSVNQYCDSKPGIVTAANAYFIINESTQNKYDLETFTIPIIKNGIFINGSIVISRNDYNKLVKSDKPVKLLDFNEVIMKDLSENNKLYINYCKKDKIHLRYKCLIRKHWYCVPNIGTPPDGFFFKRIHFYPKLLINRAKILVTDSAYKITMRNNYEINDFVFSFYNSLTLAFTEMEGRYYGEGVLELTPSEFKILPLPLQKISLNEFNNYNSQFENKKSIQEILDKYDKLILSSLNLPLEKIELIQKIYNKLLNKRFRIT